MHSIMFQHELQSLVEPIKRFADAAIQIAGDVWSHCDRMHELQSSRERERVARLDLETADADYESLLHRFGAMEIALDHEQARARQLQGELTSLRANTKERNKQSLRKVLHRCRTRCA